MHFTDYLLWVPIVGQAIVIYTSYSASDLQKQNAERCAEIFRNHQIILEASSIGNDWPYMLREHQENQKALNFINFYFHWSEIGNDITILNRVEFLICFYFGDFFVIYLHISITLAYCCHWYWFKGSMAWGLSYL